MRPKSSSPRTDFGVRLIMARSCPASNPRRGGNQLLAEFVILTLWIADLPVARRARHPVSNPLYRTPWTARARYSPDAPSSSRSKLLVSSFLPSEGHVLLFAA